MSAFIIPILICFCVVAWVYLRKKKKRKEKLSVFGVQSKERQTDDIPEEFEHNISPLQRALSAQSGWMSASSSPIEAAMPGTQMQVTS